MLSLFTFFSPVQPASGADRRTSENTNFAASFEGLFGPNQGDGRCGIQVVFWFLGSEGVLVLGRPLAGFSRGVETGAAQPLSPDPV